MNNQFLLPANSKKSALIFGLFTVTDLIIICVGGVFSLTMLFILKNPNLRELILAILPLLIGASLVYPVPNYHNVLQLITNIVNFYTGRKKYYWKGWCVKDETK